MRPTFSRFDFQDLLDTLPPFARHPMAVATAASVLAHSVVAVGLPVFAGAEQEKDPERVVDVISLSPAEQAKLPSNGLMMPGGGLNGTSAMPLPLDKNGLLSPLSGLSSSTLGSNGSSSYSGPSGLMDLPAYTPPTQTSTTASSDNSYKTSSTSTKVLFPDLKTNKFDGKTSTISFNWTNQATEQNPTTTPPPPGANNSETPPASTKVPTVEPAPSSQNQPATGGLNDSGKTTPTPTASPTPTTSPSPVFTVAQAYGQANFDENTKPVDAQILNEKANAVYGNLTGNLDKVFDQKTLLNPPNLALSLTVPPTSDVPAEKPVPAEALLLITPQGTIYRQLDQKSGKSIVNPAILRQTGYANLTKQALDYVQTLEFQKAVTEQLAKTPIEPGKYGYFKVIFTVPEASKAANT